ncbi:hypothetical protein G6F57_018923 [Rhizopus arrhizus]|nr:hypothetical protein G6F57_018923 [Rhizopus arrhizus]
MMSGVIALFLAILSVLGVLAFHFPAYLTTPELRAFYSVDAMRTLLFGALLVSGSIALANTVLGRQRWLNITAFVLVCCAVAAGGSQVVVTTTNTGNHPYLEAHAALPGPAGVPRRVAGGHEALPVQPPVGGCGAAVHQLLHPPPVFMGGLRAAASRDPVHAVSAGAVRGGAGGRPGTVRGAPARARWTGWRARACISSNC